MTAVSAARVPHGFQQLLAQLPLVASIKDFRFAAQRRNKATIHISTIANL